MKRKKANIVERRNSDAAFPRGSGSRTTQEAASLRGDAALQTVFHKKVFQLYLVFKVSEKAVPSSWKICGYSY